MDLKNGDFFNYSKTRKLEIVIFLMLSVFIILITVNVIVLKRSPREDSLHCTPNSLHYMKNITESVSYDDGLVTNDKVRYPFGYYWTADNGTIWGCPCLVKPCIQKCCARGESHAYYYDAEISNKPQAQCISSKSLLNPNKVKRAKLPLKDADLIPYEENNMSEDHFYVINGVEAKLFSLLTAQGNKQVFFLNNGSVYREDSEKCMWDWREFCMEYSVNSSNIRFMFCSDSNCRQLTSERVIPRGGEEDHRPAGWVYTLRGIGMMISIPCLLATLLVYTLLPELRNMHGKAIMCYIFSLTMSYFCLAVVLVASQIIPHRFCQGIGFAIQVSVLASFFWLNIMSFDIWRVFIGIRTMSGYMQCCGLSKFLVYSIYAWGCPLVILMVSVLLDTIPNIPNSVIRPGMGEKRCFFSDKDALVLYFYLPIGVLVFLNIGMFLTTSARLKLHAQEAKSLQNNGCGKHSRNVSELQRCGLYIKLCAMMGMNWVLDLLSFFLGGAASLWLISDLANTLLGVLVFYMFVCQHRPLLLLRQRFGIVSQTSNMAVSSKGISIKLSKATLERVFSRAESTVV